MKWLSEIIPFFEPYPTWVKVLISGWVLFTSICIVTVFMVRPNSEVTTGSHSIWLKITNVSLSHNDLENASIRATAHINGNSYTYPNVGGVRWIVPSLDMPPGRFEIPESKAYEVAFSLIVNDRGRVSEFRSQEVVPVRKLPFEGWYTLYPIEEGAHGANAAASIGFALASDPN
jgi:hypothetical protein